MEAISTLSSDEWRNYATIVAAVVALLVFIVNTMSQGRNRRIENLTRFNRAHQRLFSPDSYLVLNIIAFENGTVQRDRQNMLMEGRFHLLLLEVERLAILANNKAVPRRTQVYMFGSYAPQILELMTAEERASMFWELAVGYLEGIARDTKHYGKLAPTRREQFWR